MTGRPVLAALAAVLLLAACGTGPAHATVTGKEYKPPIITWHTVPITRRVCATKRRSCRTVTTGHRRTAVHRPACWQLELDTGAEVCVSARTWRRTHLGDHY